MAFLSRDGLKQMLLNHVIELKYQRKHPTQSSNTRRMFCTGAYPNFQNSQFLASIGAQSALGFRYPKGASPYPPKGYNPDEKNLVVTYDIFMQDYRNIYVYRCNSIRAFPVDTKNNIENFWEYFNNNIANMSQQDKIEFLKK